MPSNLRLPKIYPITDTKLSGLSHFEQTKALLEGGTKLVQIRDKTMASRELFDSVQECLALCHERDALLIVNDRADIALATDADGVHLGQDDLPPSEARKILPSGTIIGFSTHTVEQALDAAKTPVDYIAAGPIFSTRSKSNPDPVIGLSGLEKIRNAIGDLPLVAIGGITLDNCHDVLNAGADSAAMISALVAEPSQITYRLQKALEIAGA